MSSANRLSLIPSSNNTFKRFQVNLGFKHSSIQFNKSRVNTSQDLIAAKEFDCAEKSYWQ
jgi:hypothetical protein